MASIVLPYLLFSITSYLLRTYITFVRMDGALSFRFISDTVKQVYRTCLRVELYFRTCLILSSHTMTLLLMC